MSNNPEIIDIKDNIEAVGPGKILRDARISLGMSEAEVAEQLNLRPSVVADFEAEKFDSDIPSTFLKGYLKNYAKLVNVSDAVIVESLKHIKMPPKPGVQMKSFSQSTKKKAENNRLMGIIWIIVIALLSLTVLWWWQQDTKPKPIELLPVEQPAANSQPGEATPIPVPSENEPKPQAQPDTPDIAHAQTVTINEPERAPAIATIMPATLSTNVASTDKTELSANQVTQAQLVNETDLIESLDSLVLSFTGDCWVNIFDVNGDRLAWGIKKADYVMSLTGKGPFNVTLGKPELVAINYNQESINMDQFQPGQIAKFVWPKQ